MMPSDQYSNYKPTPNYYLAQPMRPFIALLLTLASLARTSSPDFLAGELFRGTYTAHQPNKTFNYLQGRAGSVIAMFSGSPNRQAVNSVDLYFLDPSYEDEKVVLLQVKEVVEVREGVWNSSGVRATCTTFWRTREEQTETMENVSAWVAFANLEGENYHDVAVQLEISGANFAVTAELRYFNQIVTTLTYSVYVSLVVLLQIASGRMVLRAMEQQNHALMGKLSLLTLSLCNISDFSSTMSHLQFIMGSESGYLFFVLPSAAYLVLFVLYDMKMLFLVWRSHNIRRNDTPDTLRKRLTAFYIQFYLGLFVYLTLNYFFPYDQWMAVLRNLLLPQLIHNIRMGNKPAFNGYYLFGYVGSRLLIPLYERTCPANRFRLSPNFSLVVILFAMFFIEILLLALQSKLGSRFFVPKIFLPNHHEYRARIKQNEQNRETDCAICLQNLFSEGFSEGAERQLLEETTVLVTPCAHSYHPDCLSAWMEVKPQCPTCRSSLPCL